MMVELKKNTVTLECTYRIVAVDMVKQFLLHLILH